MEDYVSWASVQEWDNLFGFIILGVIIYVLLLLLIKGKKKKKK